MQNWVYAYKAICREEEIPNHHKLTSRYYQKVDITHPYVESVIRQKLIIIGTIGGYDLLYAVHQELKERLEGEDEWYLLVYDRNADGIAGWAL